MLKIVSCSEKSRGTEILIDPKEMTHINPYIVATLENSGISSYKIENNGDGKKIVTVQGPYEASEITEMLKKATTPDNIDCLNIPLFYLSGMA